MPGSSHYSMLWPVAVNLEMEGRCCVWWAHCFPVSQALTHILCSVPKPAVDAEGAKEPNLGRSLGK